MIDFRFDLEDTASADDSKALRINLKYPGESIFTIWPPADQRLASVFGIRAANLSSARQANAASGEAQQDPPFYAANNNQDEHHHLEPTCRRRIDQLTLYNAYAFGVPEVLAEFFDRNLGFFILLITVSVTISAVSGKFMDGIGGVENRFLALIWLFNYYRSTRGAPPGPNTSAVFRSENALKRPGRNSSSRLEWVRGRILRPCPGFLFNI